MAWEPRTYRAATRPFGLDAFRVIAAETDLLIHAACDVAEASACVVMRLRRELESYLASHPRFGEAHVPVPVEAGAPGIARDLARAAASAGVGPMAGVAGAFAEAVAREIEPLSAEVIVENGGDIYLMGSVERVVALWAGPDAPYIGLRVGPERLPCAVATSSGTIGPSVSYGRANAATCIAVSGALADAAASAVGNRIRVAADLDGALAAGRAIDGVDGIVAVVDGAVAAWGAVELVPLGSASK